MANEEKTQEQGKESEKQEDSTGNQDTGNQYEEPETIKQANSAAQKLAQENERFEKNLKEMREHSARIALGGKSPAPQQKEKEESPEEYAQKALKGQIPKEE